MSVCITPAAPSPLPLPYPVVSSVGEGVTDPPMRTRFTGTDIVTVGSCFKNCHGNEPGTLKEVVSLNTAGPCFVIMGAPNVLIELGMAGITGRPLHHEQVDHRRRGIVGLGGRWCGRRRWIRRRVQRQRPER